MQSLLFSLVFSSLEVSGIYFSLISISLGSTSLIFTSL